MSKTFRFAVASKEGLAITEHFGHAREFYIYDVTDSQCHLLEKRNVDHYCLGGHSDKSALQGILEAVSDCHSVFVAMIGDGPTSKLAAKGIVPVSQYAYEEIEVSLMDYVKNLGW